MYIFKITFLSKSHKNVEALSNTLKTRYRVDSESRSLSHRTDLVNLVFASLGMNVNIMGKCSN